MCCSHSLPYNSLGPGFSFPPPLAFHAEAVNTPRQGLSCSLFYKTSCFRILDHQFRPRGTSVRYKKTLLSQILCLMELFSPLMMCFVFRRISGFPVHYYSFLCALSSLRKNILSSLLFILLRRHCKTSLGCAH